MPDVFDQVASGQPRLKQQLPPSMMSSGGGGGDVFDELAPSRERVAQQIEANPPGAARPSDPVLSDPAATIDARSDKISSDYTRSFPYMFGGGLKDVSRAAAPSLLSIIRGAPVKRLASSGWAATKAAAGETPLIGKPISAGLKAAVSNWKATTPMLESGDAITPWRDATRMNEPYAGEEMQEPPQTGLQPWRDATRMNEPYAGEEMQEPPQTGLQPWRDATRMNEPYAGEEMQEPPQTGLQPWRDATRMNEPYAGEEMQEPPQTGLQPWRDATRMNEPYAGEEMQEPPQTGLQPWRDATRMNEPYAGEEMEVSKPRLIQKMGGQPAENVGTPSGRLVLSPEEAQAEGQQMSLAKKMASQRGMQYAAGMKPGNPQ